MFKTWRQSCKCIYNIAGLFLNLNQKEEKELRDFSEIKIGINVLRRELRIVVSQ
jgi:hypothetical protein